MIEENGLSRVKLGVHWVFDAFALTKDGKPDLYRTDNNGRPSGGVPLGLLVAESVFGAKGLPIKDEKTDPVEFAGASSAWRHDPATGFLAIKFDHGGGTTGITF
jgi:hypothetical protein